MSPTSPKSTPASRTAFRMCALFGLLYFVQGFAEHTDGLLAQPIRSLLRNSQKSPEEIARFSALIAIPWTIKPLYGLAIDLVPLWGLGQRGYLLLCNALTILLSAALFQVGENLPNSPWLLPLMIGASTAVACSDVAVDGMMVRFGQPLSLTGRLQSVQWSCIYAAMILVGPLGGELSARELQRWGFLVVGAMAGVCFLVILGWRPGKVQPTLAPPSNSMDTADEQGASGSQQAREPDAASVSASADVPASALGYSLGFTIAFLLLWNFNPMSASALYSFLRDHLRFDERAVGYTTSFHAVGALVASAAYGTYCRKVSFPRLLQASVIAGVLAALAYLAVAGKTSALLASLLSGAAYMTGTLIQLDLAARACPPRMAATVFSGLMAACNLSIALSTDVGGRLTAWLSRSWEPTAVFQTLVLLGAAASGLCWFFIGKLTPR